MNPERLDPHTEPVAADRAPSPTSDAPLNAPKTASKDPKAPPPKPSKDLLGPYIGFKTTTTDNRWLGSILVLYTAGAETPTLTFENDSVSQSASVLYDDIFGKTALRYDIELPIPEGFGDERIVWHLKWQSVLKSGAWHVARIQQKWRGACFSCNGFDETVPSTRIAELGFDSVWKHLMSVNEDSPLHFLVWGGDQIYIDLIFKHVPFLERWLKMEWEKKWTHEFGEEASTECAKYYFNTYVEHWEREQARKSLESIPAVMQWDDHDIFDGAGSYPPELHDSPVMLGLCRTAQKFRLLFQNHTTPDKARDHGFFGAAGHNQLSQMGPRLAYLGFDGRTERDHTQVADKDSFNQIFKRLNTLPDTTQHLLVLFPVPFSFIRVRVAEKIFEFLANRSPWVRKLPGINSMNSIFGEPEFMDDLMDEWCHDYHIKERNENLARFQEFAKAKSIRVTFLSGDVHCAAFSRFRSDSFTRKKDRLKPENDHRLMYNVISSAIVNVAPTANACIAYHYIGNKFKPIKATEEAMVEFFERRPEKGKHVRHRKFMPNRNYCYIEEVGAGGSVGDSTIPTEVRRDSSEQQDPHETKHPHLHKLHHKLHDKAAWFDQHYAFDKKHGYPSTIGPTSDASGVGTTGDPIHSHGHGFFCHHRKVRKSNNMRVSDLYPSETANKSEGERSGIRLRMWLESRNKEEKGRQFASYETVVPDLRLKPLVTAAGDKSAATGRKEAFAEVGGKS